MPRLAALLRPADYLLFSANLAPGTDYAAGVQRILPLYDNALTRDWLMTFLLDVGVDGTMANYALSWRTIRLAAALNAWRPISGSSARAKSSVDGQRFQFLRGRGDSPVLLLAAHPALVRRLLGKHG